MLPTLSLMPVSVMTFLHMYVDQVMHTISKEYDTYKIVKFNHNEKKLERKTILNNAVNTSSKIIHISEPNNQLNSNDVDFQIKTLHWKLKKNLETLVFLSELESRYENEGALAEMIKEYYAIKKTVQMETVEISNQLSHHKLSQHKCA